MGTPASDVSQNLDIVAQVPGDMLVRGANGWARLPASEIGYQLQAQGPNLAPIFVAGQPGVRLVKSATQNQPAGTAPALIFQSAAFDDASFWSAGSPTRITVPSSVSRMSFTGGWASSTSAINIVSVHIADKNGDLVVGQQATGVMNVRLQVATGPLAVTPGDWFEVLAFGQSTHTIAADFRSFFAAQVERAA